MINVDRDEALKLLPFMKTPPDEGIPEGASASAIQMAENRLGLKYPSDFREWLMVTNGPPIGRGGMLGIHPVGCSEDIENVLKFYSAWVSNNWIPVAGNGCGDYYVLVHESEKMNSVAFIDCAFDSDRIAYVIASNLWTFLRYYFESELADSDTEWPFNKDETLKNDPDLLNSRLPLPWES